MPKTDAKSLTACGLIAAVYAVLCLVFSLTSFGPAQIRVAEALTLLPVVSPWGVAGVSVGCLIANILGASMGLTPVPDILFGTVATLLAAVLTRALRSVRWHGVPVLAALPPILVNGLVIGLELTLLGGGGAEMFLTCAASVAAGQLLPCLALGLPLVLLLEKKGLDRRLLGAPGREDSHGKL